MIRAFLLSLIVGSYFVASAPVALADENAIAEEIVTRVNELRQSNGLMALRPHEALSKAAVMHSQDMIVHDFFDHVSPLQGRAEPSDRARMYQYPASSTLAENLFMSMGRLDGVAADCVRSWMESPSHRKNLLDQTRTEIGVGVAISSEGELYVTAMFGRPSR